jgi:hypothetical protein
MGPVRSYLEFVEAREKIRIVLLPPCQEAAGENDKLGKLAPVFGLIGRCEIGADGAAILSSSSLIRRKLSSPSYRLAYIRRSFSPRSCPAGLDLALSHALVCVFHKKGA